MRDLGLCNFNCAHKLKGLKGDVAYPSVDSKAIDKVTEQIAKANYKKYTTFENTQDRWL